MTGQLPPLGSLRAFEAVARRLSFTRAADELHVTPGAVSQRVRQLEELLCQRLFVRTKRSVALTEIGMRMLPDVQAGLDTLSRAIRSHSSPTGHDRILTVSVAPSFASKWLLPRLADFTEHNPDIDLRVSATVGLADLERDGVDLAIRLGRGPYPNVRLEALFGESLTPLCSPNLVKSKGRLRSPEDLRKHKLIHDTSIPGENEQSAWRRWLDFAGATAVPHQRGLRFSLAELAMQAAIDGSGIVLGRTVLAEGDLASGKLVRPFNIVLPLNETYYLVFPKNGPLRRESIRFREWITGFDRSHVKRSRRRR
jgi:LysR family transcriptional regulator, glycine cleavage system transcriptional activator